MEVPEKKTTSYLSQIKKYFPYIILFVLTVALMLFFRYNKRSFNRMFEEGANNLISLAKNLKPLLFKTEITNEDVFNFALFQSLPLDKEKNKVLLISTNEPGNNVYEIKPVSLSNVTNNYQTFTSYLELSPLQKEKADSILNLYKKEIYSSVLANKDDVFAVNPKLVDLQQAVLADIIAFAQKVNPEKSKQLFSQKFKFYNDQKISNLIASAKDIPQNEYLLITPDTVAKTHFEWNRDKFDKYLSDLEKVKEMELKRKEMQNQEAQLHYQFKMTPDREKNFHPSRHEADYSFKIDSNLLKVVVPSAEVVEGLDRMIDDTLRIKLKEAAKIIRGISIPKVTMKESSRFHNPKVPPPPPGKSKEVKIVDPYEIINKTMQMLSNQKLGELIEYGMKMQDQKNAGLDSLKKAKIKEAMKKMNKELERFKELKVDTTKVD